MARIRDLVIDSRHPASLARFWEAALDDYAIAPYDDAELARLRERGIDDPEDDPTVLLEPRSPGSPRIFVQAVPEPKTVKNRMHVDLRCDDPDAEVRRLTGLGARVLETHDGLVTMADPEGNEFCVLRPPQG
jgi:hypothetical protein